MDILSPKTLTLIRDVNVGRAIDELLDAKRDDDTRVVETAQKVRIRIRRIG